MNKSFFKYHRNRKGAIIVLNSKTNITIKDENFISIQKVDNDEARDKKVSLNIKVHLYCYPILTFTVR